jgi:IS30 family transposase
MTAIVKPGLDERTAAAIVGAVRAGCSMRTAARAGGRDRSTVYRYLQRGKSDREEGIENAYTRVLDEYEHAESELIAEVEANVISQSKRDWKAGAWVLKHRHPTTYNREGAAEVAQEVAEALLHRIRQRCRPETYQDVVENALDDVIEVKP